jgi:hypothetical protein
MDESHEKPASQNFAFVMNLGSLDAESYEVIPGHVLRRATSAEIGEIKETISRLVASPFGPFETLLWQQEWPLPEDRPAKILTENEWRYFVIAFEGPNRLIGDIQTAMDLSKAELEIGFSLVSHFGLMGGRGVIFHAGRLFQKHQFAQCNEDFFIPVTNADISEITSNFDLLRNDSEKASTAKRVAGELGQLKGFPESSPLRDLGYFTLLEALLTHPPDPNDRHETLTNQIKRKIALLNNRWETPLDYAAFGENKPDKIWAKMYSYRSAIAHGDVPDFAKDLKLLKDREEASKLVKQAAKAVIRQALLEPQLVLDLREC